MKYKFSNLFVNKLKYQKYLFIPNIGSSYLQFNLQPATQKQS